MDKYSFIKKILGQRDFVILSIFTFLVLPFFSYAGIKIQQPLDVFCNENLICELELNEDVDTCPTDCYLDNPADPDVVQQSPVSNKIKIDNVKVSVGIGGTIISWETNKPTATSLILSDGIGEIKKGYIDEFYVIKHSVMIDSFVFEGDYFFKIFSKGVYGDNNYDYAELFTVKQSYQEQFSEQNIIEEKQVVDKETLTAQKNSVSSKTIKKSSEGLDSPIVFLVGSDGKTAIVDFIKTNLNKFKNNTVGCFVAEFIWQILISLGILWLLFLLLIKN